MGPVITQKTVFGWVLTGRISQQNSLNFLVSFFNYLDLRRRKVPKFKKVSTENKFCEDLYGRKTTRNMEGCYVATLPFKSQFPSILRLDFFQRIVLLQLTKNETRLLKSPELKNQYDSVIKEYYILTKVNVDLAHSPNSNYYFLLHTVFKHDSTTNKLRVIFNASNRPRPRPALQSDLTILILRWRLFRYVFNADIEKMYREMLIRP